jgi:putative oligomerization/nucleic acid binding protein
MIMRRRPLLRAAAVGGGAYVAGKKMERRSAGQAQQEAAQDERTSDVGRSGQGQPGAQPAAPVGQSVADQLKQLSALHEQGVLTDGEFSAAKSKLLGTP